MRASVFFCLLVTRVAWAGTPLTIEDAVTIAKTRHPTIQSQRALVESAQGRVEQARAGFIPAPTASFAYIPQTANFVLSPSFARFFGATRSTGVEVNGFLVPCASGQMCPIEIPPTMQDRPTSYQLFNFWSASVGLVWNAFDWGRTYYALRAAKETRSAQRLTVESTTAQVVLEVKVAFYTVLATQAALEVALEAVATQKRHVEQAQAFFQVGTRTKIDVASAQSELANAELQVARARGNLDVARAQLSTALGEDEWRDYELVVPAELAEPGAIPPAEALYDEALSTRPEPRELSLRASGLKNTVRSLRGAFFPALTFSFGSTFAGTDITRLTPNVQLNVSLGYPSSGVNPFLIHGQMHEAEGQRLQLVAQERQIRHTIRLEAATARAQLVAAREAVQTARTLVAAARERRDLAEGRYRAGVGSIIELTDAELAFVNARYQEVQARFDHAQAHARMERVLGRL